MSSLSPYGERYGLYSRDFLSRRVCGWDLCLHFISSSDQFGQFQFPPEKLGQNTKIKPSAT